ncbi:MAG: VWA domain-containing protein [Lachnospiraceae bacterium]|nr:VWA domain-containing protein [Lachnospiraceae bacterium]
MSFTSLWPLVFLIGIPVIILLYILKPRGKDMEISSNLLWEKLFKHRQSRTFFEKFRSEILMALQILTVLLLTLALMAPFVMMRSSQGGSTTIILDASLSMQHVNASGDSRLDLAKEEALDYIASASGEISLIAVSDEANILLANSTDRNRLKEAVEAVKAADREGNMQDAFRLAATLESDNLLILTDGDGAASAGELSESLHADMIDVGEEASNVSLDYVSLSEDGKEAALRFTNYSGSRANFDVTLYDAQGGILGMQQASTEAGKSSSILFSGLAVEDAYVRAELTAIRFEDSGLNDSLNVDNRAYTLGRRAGTTHGILIGEGNTFVERAYTAICGEALTRTVTDSAISAGSYNVAIYDAGFIPQGAKSGRNTEGRSEDGVTINMLRFENSGGSSSADHVVVNVSESPVTEGLKAFSIGSNVVQFYDLPEWAESFMEVDGKCVGYYGVNENHKEVVVGFDIRETDFPVQAEFPVFMAGALSYLSDMSLLGKDIYEAGELIQLNPSAEVTAADMMVSDVNGSGEEQQALAADMDHAGLFKIRGGEKEEYFVIRPSVPGRDGRATAEDVHSGGAFTEALAKRNLTNALLIAVIVLLLIEWLIFMKKMNYRGKFYLITRSVLLLLCILALLGIRLPKRSRLTTTVFLVDLSVSDSDNLKAFDEYIDNAVSHMPKNNQYAIVTFGRDASVQQFVTDEDMYMGLGTKTDATATNFESGLQRAVSMLPSDSAGRIVVLTDGKETAGNLDRTAALFIGGDVSLEAVLLESASGDDVYVKNVDMPETLHSGDSYYLKVAVESNFDTKARITLLSGGKEVAKEAVELKKGSNEFVFEETVTSDDVESYEVRVEAEGDSVKENNSYSAYARVEDAPRILVLKGKGESGSAFESVLDAAHVNAEFMRPGRAPRDLNEMLAYKAIILENVMVEELPEEFMNNLEGYVRDYGGGFAACGGEDSFMMGGYNDTSIETVLPVNMELRGTVQIPTTGIVMVIDHSGSMVSYAGSGLTYLDVAVEAAKRGVDNLRDDDMVGILAFDDTYTWAHRISDASDKDGIKNDIERITDGGGTVIMPALDEARKELENCNAEVKHIILLTDGMGETNDFSMVADRIRRSGITLSTVAVGSFSDTQLMENLANACGGRYYYADANTDIPRIFAQEVFLGGGTYIRNGDYPVVQKMNHELVSGLFEEGWYNVRGYIAATPKTGSQSLLVSGQDDPLLTVWQYGLGKTVAWNSDVDGGWSAAYSGDESYAELWKRIADFLGGTPGIGEDYMDVSSKDGKTVITYHSSQYGDGTQISGLYTSPEGTSGDISFTSAEPGVYTAELDSVETGLYNINIRRSDDGEVTGAFTTATVVQYSDEYRFDVTDVRFRNFINQYGSWRTLEDNVWKKLDVSKNGSFSLTPLLLILLMLAFIADIAGRRFGWEPVIKKRKKKQKAKEDGLSEDLNKLMTEAEAEKAKAAAEEEEKQRRAERMEQMKRDGLDVPDTGTLDTAALLKRKKNREMK